MANGDTRWGQRGAAAASHLGRTLADWGVPAGVGSDEARRLRVANLYSLTVAALIVVAYAPLFYFLLDHLPLALGALAVALGCALVPALHARGYVRGGRAFLLLLSNASIFAFSLALGPNSGVHLLLFCVACAPMTLLDSRPRWPRYAFGALPIGLLCAAVVIGRARPAPVEVPPRVALLLELSLCLTVLGLLAAVIFYYVQTSEAATRELKRLNRQSRDELGSALRKSELRFQQLVAQAADALLVLDERGQILDANEQATRDLGHAREALLDSHVDRLNGDGTLSATLRELDALEQQGHTTLECTFCRADGSTYPVEVRVGIVRLEGTRHVLTLARDIEHRRAMEAKLMFADRMVSVGTLAAGVAHEINNPLTYMGMNLDYLRSQEHLLVAHLDPVLAERVRQAITRALDGSERVATIVRDLKTFARGGTEDREVVDVNQVLESTLSLAEGAVRKRARVQRQLADVPGVRGNEARLGQVLLNLVLNAAQAFDGVTGRDPVIQVLTHAHGGQVVIEVRDNGQGIADADLARIFDPFFTTKPVGVGTGLGLFICQNIVHSFGGDIEVQSRLGEGTRVRLRLPPARVHSAGRPTDVAV